MSEVTAKTRFLPKRLDAVMQLIDRSTKVVADVGYDHGKLIKKLVLRSPEQLVIGIDRQPQAADRFWATRWKKIHAAKDRISLRRGDGLAPLQPGEADIVVFAGLSQGNISRMLKNNPEIVGRFRRMVFCPIDHTAHLIPCLEEIGWQVCEELLAFDHRRFYHVWASEQGRRAENRQTRFFGPRLFEAQNPYLYHFLQQQRKVLEPVLANVEKQRPDLQALCKQIDGAIEMAKAFATRQGIR